MMLRENGMSRKVTGNVSCVERLYKIRKFIQALVSISALTLIISFFLLALQKFVQSFDLSYLALNLSPTSELGQE